jgi:hypothetical protein
VPWASVLTLDESAAGLALVEVAGERVLQRAQPGGAAALSVRRPEPLDEHSKHGHRLDLREPHACTGRASGDWRWPSSPIRGTKPPRSPC